MLTQLPGDGFNVDSSFVVAYEFNFQGNPGSALNGVMAVTEEKVLMRAGDPMGLVNDSCRTALSIFDGDIPYSNIGATLDGPSPCGDLGSDVWFQYTATCSLVGENRGQNIQPTDGSMTSDSSRSVARSLMR